MKGCPMHKGGPAGVQTFRAFATRLLVIDGGAASSAVDPPHAEPRRPSSRHATPGTPCLVPRVGAREPPILTQRQKPAVDKRF